MTATVKHGEMKQQHPLEEDQVEEAKDGHMEEGCMKQTRRVRSRSPVIQGSAEVSTVRLGNVDEDVVVSFPDFRGQHGPVTL